MKKLGPVLLALIWVAPVHGQDAQFVMNGNPYVVFDNASASGTYLVISNPAPTGIVTIPAGAGNIVAEREKNKIRWINGTQTGVYTVPFTTSSNVKIPLVVNKTTAGGSTAGISSMILSTYNWVGATAAANAWNNLAYKPSDVTHMNDNPTGALNNSKNAIDRFWIIDPAEESYAYTANPQVTLTFTYDAVGDLSADNDITTSSVIGAQRFHTDTEQWGDMLPLGTSSSGQVAGAIITPTNFYRSWTLASNAVPLPIQLVAWAGECEGNSVLLLWSTATEKDNAYFTVEKSTDGADWSAIGEVDGAGNSQSMLHYSMVDVNGGGLAYYRLRQTDYNGKSELSGVIAAGCDAVGGTQIVNAWDDGTDLNIVVTSSLEGIYDLTLLDAQGKVMTVRPSQTIHTGVTTLKVDKNLVAMGVYVVQLHNATDLMSRRIVLQ